MLSLLVLGVGAGACVDRSAVEDRDAGVYEEVVRWFLADVEPSTPIFLDHRDELEIDLAVQAEVLERLDDFESVRFIDTVAEAVDESGLGAPVRDGGVFVRLGTVMGETTAAVTATRYHLEDRTVTYSFELRRRDAGWAIESPPILVQPLG